MSTQWACITAQMYAVLEGSINGVNIEKLTRGAARDGWPRVSACSASPLPRPILGATPLVLTVVVLLLLPAEGLGRGRASRAWIAIRDMDVPAEIIGIRPLRTKLLAFLSSFYRGIAGAVRAFI